MGYSPWGQTRLRDQHTHRTKENRGAEVKMRSRRRRVDPDPMTDVPIRKQRHRHTRDRRPREDRGWRDAATSQGTPGAPDAGRGEEGPFPRAFGGTSALATP